ncbi:SapC family protein [Aerophototrophica crusticola]|uniref:SapC family protein n=1 Tax=Aerophototrophica crusticola TaxID=1709002 RepID=A0A858R993_9PROT|nr:SapC family protein [Rhodospirillaceae bacterium B3]
MTDVANAADTPVLPLFYNNPVAVSAQRHGSWKVRQDRDFSYAAGTHAVPVIVDEIPALQGHYPIVFSGGENPGVIALVGLRQDENLMVDADNKWRQGYPVPAYVQRYPFLLVEIPQDQRFVLIMEEDARCVGPNGQMALFEDGKGTKFGNDLMDYCVAFNNSAQVTAQFCEALNAQGLLVEQRADVITHDGKRLSLSGFKVVDEQKFNALPDETFLEWRKRGWVGLVYAHMMSLGRWQSLIDIMRERDTRAA